MAQLDDRVNVNRTPARKRKEASTPMTTKKEGITITQDQHRPDTHTPAPNALPVTLENGCVVVDETVTEAHLQALRLID
jgi:hypothetical protein